MSRTLTAADRSALIRLASTMPAGSPERKAILAGLAKVKVAGRPVVYFSIEVEVYVIREEAENGVLGAKVLMLGEKDVVPGRSIKRLEDKVIASVSSIFKLGRHPVRTLGYRNGALECFFFVNPSEVPNIKRLIKKHSYAGTDQIITGVEYTITRDFEISTTG